MKQNEWAIIGYSDFILRHDRINGVLSRKYKWKIDIQKNNRRLLNLKNIFTVNSNKIVILSYVQFLVWRWFYDSIRSKKLISHIRLYCIIMHILETKSTRNAFVDYFWLRVRRQPPVPVLEGYVSNLFGDVGNQTSANDRFSKLALNCKKYKIIIYNHDEEMRDFEQFIFIFCILFRFFIINILIF